MNKTANKRLRLFAGASLVLGILSITACNKPAPTEPVLPNTATEPSSAPPASTPSAMPNSPTTAPNAPAESDGSSMQQSPSSLPPPAAPAEQSAPK